MNRIPKMTEAQYLAKLEAIGLSEEQTRLITDVIDEMLQPVNAKARIVARAPGGAGMQTYLEGKAQGMNVLYHFFAGTLQETDEIDHDASA
jgi:hypothetical protein